MKKMYKTRRDRLALLGSVTLSALLLGLFVVVVPSMAQGGVQGAVCVESYTPGARCTANDVRLEELIMVNLVEGCTQGTIGEMEAEFEGLVSAVGSPDRYDIGLFIALDGGDAINAGGTCFHGYLDAIAQPLTETPVYGDWYPPSAGDAIPDVYNLDPAFIGYWNGEPGDPTPDECGDMETNTQALKRIEGTLRLPCLDLIDGAGNPSPDGFVDVGVCASWDNNANTTCLDVNGAVPGTGSKCSCSRVNLPVEQPATKSGMKFEDVNGNGAWDDGTDQPYEDWSIYLIDAAGVVTPTQTDASGYYTFTVTPGQTYTVCEDLQTDWTQSYPTLAVGDATSCPGPYAPVGYAINLGSGDVDDDNDFGNWRYATKSGVKFNDFNNNGVNDGEPALSGWNIHLLQLIDSAWVHVDTTTFTDASGMYEFTNIVPGETYAVCEVLQAGWEQSFPAVADIGTGGIIDCGVLAAIHGPTGYQISLTSGEVDEGNDFGNYEPGICIDFEKHTNDEDADNPTGPNIPEGGDVTWEYVITNCGDAYLEDVVVMDNKEGYICTEDVPPHSSVSCFASGTSKTGQYKNMGEACYYPPDQQPICDDDPSHYIVEKKEEEFVPEWVSIGLLGSGLASLLGYARMRRRKR
jgi:hypothetical protein